MIKQSIMLTEVPEVEWNCYTRSHNSDNSHAESAYLSGRTKKVISRKLKCIFAKKLHHNYKNILGYKI